MNSRIEMLFEGGKNKALTFSYDDNTIYDRKLVDLMNRYGMKGTFNLNSGLFSDSHMAEIDGVEIDFSRIDEQEVKDLYDGHEVASHTVNHPSLTDISAEEGRKEVRNDRAKLEELVGYTVSGFAYPYGTFNKEVEALLSECGITYARTVVDTEDFVLPQDFLEWHPTCHHSHQKLMEFAEKFCAEDREEAKLFYLWGHSYEFKRYDNWQVIEDFMRYMEQHKEKIWIATNKEIRDYVEAYRQLVFSEDTSVLHNPTDITIWYKKDGQICQILPDEKQVVK